MDLRHFVNSHVPAFVFVHIFSIHDSKFESCSQTEAFQEALVVCGSISLTVLLGGK